LRRFGWICLVMLVGLCSAIIFLRYSVSVVTAASHSVSQAKLLKTSVKGTLSLPAVPAPTIDVPPGDTLYAAKRGEAVVTVARRYLGQTSYLTSSELSDAIRKANGDYAGTFFKANQQGLIPGILRAPIVEKIIPIQRDFEARAIYLTAIMAASDHGIRIVKQWRAVGGNAVVFDIKDSDGSVNIPFDYPLLGQHHVVIHDLPKYIRFLHSENMHAIARVAIFRDQHLVETHPELAVKSRKTGLPWRENGKLVWTDSSNPKVQDYDIALAKAAAEAGADEIQFDYVRFPAEGDQKDASFNFETAHPGWHRPDVITDFLKRAYAQIHPTGALLSLDVFGVMAWQRPADLNHTGQDIVGMAKYCDVISPMIYPSHFFKMDGYDHPGDAPEHFIGESMARFEKITAGSGVVIRPWLQAFRWRTKTYSPDYIKVQVLTAKEKGGIGFLFWNAANDYSKPYIAMPEMKASAGKYFRGDELPKTMQASLAHAN
jgi:hypothetical protein